MKPARGSYIKKITLLFLILFVILWGAAPVFSYPVSFTDAEGNKITITQRPSRVVSVVPSITEIIFKIGAGDTVKAVTYHDTYPPETATKEIIGGFFSPSLMDIEKIQPDVIFLSGLRLFYRSYPKFAQVPTVTARQ